MDGLLFCIVKLKRNIKLPNTNDDHYYCLISCSVPIYFALKLLVEPFSLKCPSCNCWNNFTKLLFLLQMIKGWAINALYIFMQSAGTSATMERVGCYENVCFVLFKSCFLLLNFFIQTKFICITRRCIHGIR